MQVVIARASIAISIIILVLTLAAGIISDSITLLLDAAAEFIMVFMAFMLNSNIKKTHLPPDQLFNFGYEKFEPFTVTMQGALIMLSCIIASYFAIQDIVHADDIARYDIPAYVSLFTGTLAIGTAVYFQRIAARTRSHMLKAASLHWSIDGLLSLVMCLGFLFGFYMHKLGYLRITPYVDPAMALILAAVLVWTPIKMMKRSFRQLVDAVPVKEVRDEIGKVIEEHKVRAFGIRNIRMRRAGEKVFLDICFMVHGHTTMVQTKEFAENFEKDIAKKFPKYDVIVYFHPAV